MILELVTPVLALLLSISEILPLVRAVESNGILDAVVRCVRRLNDIDDELAPLVEGWEVYRNRFYIRSHAPSPTCDGVV